MSLTCKTRHNYILIHLLYILVLYHKHNHLKRFRLDKNYDFKLRNCNVSKKVNVANYLTLILFRIFLE